MNLTYHKGLLRDLGAASVVEDGQDVLPNLPLLHTLLGVPLLDRAVEPPTLLVLDDSFQNLPVVIIVLEFHGFWFGSHDQ